MNGGYINIDVIGLDIANTEKQTINGIYKKTLDAIKTDKPVFLYNAVFGDYGKVSPICVFCTFVNNEETDEEQIICSTSKLQIVIDKNDIVEIK